MELSQHLVKGALGLEADPGKIGEPDPAVADDGVVGETAGGLESATTIIIAIVLIYAVVVRGMSATQGAYLANLFPDHIRFTGLASAREVGSAISDGLGPVVATLLIAATHRYWPVALYMISQAVITIVAVWVGPSRQKPLEDRAVEPFGPRRTPCPPRSTGRLRASRGHNEGRVRGMRSVDLRRRRRKGMREG
ncbi:MAG: hypothetical protein JOY78_10780 [Pseudonocardia sp.]|nr:hypothetical protein [Pseudonocardia sp.]